MNSFLRPAFLFTLVLGSLIAARAAHLGPIEPPTDPFGAPGLYGVETRTFPSPRSAGHVVTVFSPAGLPGPRPTWFFCHGFGGSNVTYYTPLLAHLASHGWAVVFSPYPITGSVEEHYEQLFSGFTAAAALYPDIIDTRKVAFAGHSFGGGAAPGLFLRAVRDLGWGAEGRCLMPMAPWFSYELSHDDLATFPVGTQVVMQVYEDDLMNDHRMAIDVFRRLTIPSADKDYIMLRSDEIQGYGYEASHAVPGRSSGDALAERGVFRIAAALAASCFDGSAAGRAIALGGGTPEQCAMGEDAYGRALRPLFVTDDPMPLFPQSRYSFPFRHALNPRVLSPPPEPPVARAHLVNLSARAYSGAGDRVLIAGAVIEGTRPKSLLVRAAGPAIAPFGVEGAMPEPQLRIFRGNFVHLGNAGWSSAHNIEPLEAATDETGAFAFADGSADAAVYASFGPGSVTAQPLPGPSGPGVVLAEVYDADLDPSTRLVNLSARAWVGTGDTLLVAGFVIQGTDRLRVLVRAAGPALAGLDVPEVLPDPQLVVIPNHAPPLAENDDWDASPDAEAVAAAAGATGAFAFPPGSKDAGLLLMLPAGVYTAHVSDTAGRSGNVLVEVYAVPE